MSSNFIFRIVTVNLNGLTQEKATQIVAMQKRWNFNVLVLIETHHEPGRSRQGSVSYQLLRSVFPHWHLHHVPGSRHGEAIFAHPDIGCVPIPTIRIAPLDEDDRRQVAMTLTREGYTCQLLGFHYESSYATPGMVKGAKKLLQMNATAEHFTHVGPFTNNTIWVAVGDANISPGDPMYGQMQKTFRDIQMEIESYLLLGRNEGGSIVHPWTREFTGQISRMLDYDVVRLPPGLQCRVDLTDDPPITSDHSRYLILTIGKDGVVIARDRCNTWYRQNSCITCGRGHEVGEVHNPCPCVNIDGLVRVIRRDRSARVLSTTPGAIRKRESLKRKRAGEPRRKPGRKPGLTPAHQLSDHPEAVRKRLWKQRKAAGQTPLKRGRKLKPFDKLSKTGRIKRLQMSARTSSKADLTSSDEEPSHDVMSEDDLPSLKDDLTSSEDEDGGRGEAAANFIN
ncbi:hypothetical protein Fcan01_19370 [Folsomia candida]|uniref:Endonuclease/exonuclease/phosphatase domain-containing protein n=1 Tax=Folsomia candida TaxID=158441 RepID=A0A226DKX7_FOLCA|nr:hypothetical protein Fcan01_19370 [Folsomia candida]